MNLVLRKFSPWLLSIILLAGALMPFSAIAQNPDTNDSKNGIVICGNKTNDPCTVTDVLSMFAVLTNFLFGLAGFVAVIAITISAFLFVQSAGNQGARETAKKRLSGAIIGLILVALSFVIVNAIFVGVFNVGVFSDNPENILGDPGSFIQGN